MTTNGHTIFYHVKNKKLHEIQLRNLKEINKN